MLKYSMTNEEKELDLIIEIKHLSADFIFKWNFAQVPRRAAYYAS